MKTILHPSKPLVFGALAVLALHFNPALRADPTVAAAGTASATPEAKDHTLFMGLNLEIQDGGSYYKILGVTRDSAVIRVNGQPKLIPLIDIKQYKQTVEIKAAGLPVTVDHFVSERAYTPANDPKRIWRSRESEVTGYADDLQSNAQAKISMDAMFNSGKHETQGANPVAIPNTGVQAGINSDSNALSQEMGNAPSEMGDDSYYERKMQEDLDKQLFDAAEVSFEVSSPVELDAPYAVIVTDIRDKADSAESARWIVIKPLPPIYSQPVKVDVMQGGFTPGFALGKCQVHLYNGGHEVPTSIASGRMTLTRTQVLMYEDIQYVAGHAKQTLQPAPMHDSAPFRLREDVGPADLSQVFKVSIDTGGHVVDLSSSSGEIPHYTQDIWRKLRFYPALDNGRPVAATVDAKLADFVE